MRERREAGRYTYDHVCKTLLLFHGVVDVRRDEAVELIERIVLALFSFQLGARLGGCRRGIRHELLEELNSSVDERRRLRALPL